jgi:hypothetical protein
MQQGKSSLNSIQLIGETFLAMEMVGGVIILAKCYSGLKYSVKKVIAFK